jgi:hypothetical protein
MHQILLGYDQRRRKSNTTNDDQYRTAQSYGNCCTHILTCVGFARMYRLFKSRHNCHAVRPLRLFSSSITTAFNKPLPRTSFTNGEFSARTADLNISPRCSARCARFSSIRTLSAVMATAHPNGFLWKISDLSMCGRASCDYLPSIGTAMFPWSDA